MRYLILGLAAFTLAATPARAQDPARMDVVVRADADKGDFMGAVLVAKDGKILFDRGYGSANLEWKIANDGDTKFRLGSVTKQFTATSILLLAERGKLSLDAAVKTYLPDAPAAWDKVTVRNLLNHSSGIPNFTGFEDYGKTKALATTPADLIARFRDKPLDFAPGERMDYSNSGYVVLTAIVEKLSGQSYAAFVTDNIFKPLGMADSGYDNHKTVLARRASGYSPGPGGVVNADYLDMTVPAGAGGLYSTTHDLLKWQTGMFGGKVLKPESFTAFTTPYKNNYALGIVVAKADGKTSIEHSGGIDGFNTWVGHDPDARLTVIVLANLNGGAASKLGKSLMTLARGGEVKLTSERKAITVTPAKLQEYVGSYELTPTFGFVVRYEAGKLTAQATKQDALEIFAEKPDFFFFRATDAQIAFTRDAAGKVTGAVLHQGGREIPVKKK